MMITRYTTIKLTASPTDARYRVYDTLTEAPTGGVGATAAEATAMARVANRVWRERLARDAGRVVVPMEGRPRYGRLRLVPPAPPPPTTDEVA